MDRNDFFTPEVESAKRALGLEPVVYWVDAQAAKTIQEKQNSLEIDYFTSEEEMLAFGEAALAELEDWEYE